jgi:hypothetical protein
MIERSTIDPSAEEIFALEITPPPAPAGNGTPTKGRWGRVNTVDIGGEKIWLQVLHPRPSPVDEERDCDERTMGVGLTVAMSKHLDRPEKT